METAQACEACHQAREAYLQAMCSTEVATRLVETSEAPQSRFEAIFTRVKTVIEIPFWHLHWSMSKEVVISV